MRFSISYIRTVYASLTRWLMSTGASGLALLVGIVFGGILAFATGSGQLLLAVPVTEDEVQDRHLREGAFPDPFAPLEESRFGARDAAPEILPVRRADGAEERPKIAIVIDDMGLDAKMFGRINDLPGPLTLSFLPYAPDAQRMIDAASGRGHGIMLHLPMEPQSRRGKASDPGPDVLLTKDSEAELWRKLTLNLERLSGYQGVNNHMGSALTADQSAMITVLKELDARGLFFVDSVTSDSSKAGAAAQSLGLSLLRRDVFLDADHGEEGIVNVKRQLLELEDIARIQGQAIAIAHPYESTIEALGPWLVTAQARGFDLVTVTQLESESRENTQALSALR